VVASNVHPHTLQAIRDAGYAAGLKSIRIISSSTAAALGAYALDRLPVTTEPKDAEIILSERHVLVFDLVRRSEEKRRFSEGC